MYLQLAPESFISCPQGHFSPFESCFILITKASSAHTALLCRFQPYPLPDGSTWFVTGGTKYKSHTMHLKSTLPPCPSVPCNKHNPSCPQQPLCTRCQKAHPGAPCGGDVCCAEDQAWLCMQQVPLCFLEARVKGAGWQCVADPGRADSVGQLCFMHRCGHLVQMARDSLRLLPSSPTQQQPSLHVLCTRHRVKRLHPPHPPSSSEMGTMVVSAL